MIARSPVLWYFEKCFHFIYCSRHTKASTALYASLLLHEMPRHSTRTYAKSTVRRCPKNNNNNNRKHSPLFTGWAQNCSTWCRFVHPPSIGWLRISFVGFFCAFQTLIFLYDFFAVIFKYILKLKRNAKHAHSIHIGHIFIELCVQLEIRPWTKARIEAKCIEQQTTIFAIILPR